MFLFWAERSSRALGSLGDDDVARASPALPLAASRPPISSDRTLLRAKRARPNVNISLSLLNRSALLVSTLALLALPAAAQQPLDQLSPGPFDTATWDWDFGSVQTTNPNSGNTLNVSHFGQLTYPTDGSAGPLPPAANPEGGLPLVVFGHGRFFSAATAPTNHLEAAYLMERLASWGIASTSVNLGVVGQFGFPAAIPQRGDIFRATAERTLDLANQPGTPPAGLAQALDGSRIGLLGHSRGGEGAVAAAVQNMLAGSPLQVIAVGTIAPTDFEAYTIDAEMPYMGLYGSRDGDVNNGWPIRLHDRARSEDRTFEFIHGANHFWFTEGLTFAGEGAADIPRALHHEIAMGYLAGFMAQQLGISDDPRTVFADGPEMLPVTSQATILPMYRDPIRLEIENFQNMAAPLLETSEGLLSGWGGFRAVIEDSLQQQPLTLYHRTRGAAVAFDQPSNAWAAQIPPGVDPVATPFLSVQFMQRLSAPLNTPGLDQDVTLALIDAQGDLATLPLSDYGRIPWPITHAGTQFPDKSVLRTTRVPLTEFTALNPALDLDQLSLFAFVADRTSQGELEFDAIELSR